MKFKFNYLILAAFLTANFSAKAIPTPEAVEPQYDDTEIPHTRSSMKVIG